MIGNDIVDLALAKKESNWKRPRFLDKIFTPYEQSLILNSENQDTMVWNLWSRKEAAYKIYNRETGIRTYNPIQLECVYEDVERGKVICNGNTYYTKTIILADEIHSIAVTKESYFSQIVYQEPTIQYSKIDGLPFLVDRKLNTLSPVSISHHGRYKAIVSF